MELLHESNRTLVVMVTDIAMAVVANGTKPLALFLQPNDSHIRMPISATNPTPACVMVL